LTKSTEAARGSGSGNGLPWSPGRIGTVVFRKASAEAVTAVRDVGAAIWDIEAFAGIIAALRQWHQRARSFCLHF
jgi:hypothetical protein